MKNGEIIKSAGGVTAGELELINKYTRRSFGADEVYVFTVQLCDNEIDRDYERFTVESLFELEKLFVGKTGIYDHNASAKNQTARIFSCEVQAVEGKKTATGDDYFRLIARAYLVRHKLNEELIMALDGGITKEVSISCAVKSTVCSICGNDINSGKCKHQRGRSYNSVLCYGELILPYDAYEFSFVAVPAQKSAGVIKAYSGDKERNYTDMLDIVKSLCGGEQVTISGSQARQLADYIAELEQLGSDGRQYREMLTKELVRLSAIVQPQISSQTMQSVAKSLTVAQLREFCRAYSEKSADFLPMRPQTAGKPEGKPCDTNTQFKM